MTENHGPGLSLTRLRTLAIDKKVPLTTRWNGGRATILEKASETINRGSLRLEGGQKIYELRFPTPTGVDMYGRKVFSVRVVMRVDEVWNAYPIP